MYRSLRFRDFAHSLIQSALLLWSVLQSRSDFFAQYGPYEYLADFLLSVLCLLSAVTIYSSNPIALNALLILPALGLYILGPTKKASKQALKPSHPKEEVKDLDPLPVRPFITAYRGGMMIITCISILAVDFRVFPRRFAKVETWGTSLMDMGVGSFVFSAGLVAARPVLQARLGGERSSLTGLLLASPRSSLPLLVLGFIRLYSVKGLDYAEHVSEYGVHWNFFFTLALLPPFVSLFQPVITKVHAVVLALLFGGVYEIILQSTDLRAYILTAPRTDLISQNREGLFSFLGYLALFLIGQGLGLQILPRSVSRETVKSPSAQRKHLFFHLAGNSVLWTVLYAVSVSYRYGLGLQVSRRLANFSYISWVAAFNCSQLLAFYVIEQFCFPNLLSAKDQQDSKTQASKATSRVLKAYNRNGLAIFLIANLLTGLVNLTLDTLTMSRLGAMGILVGYCSTLTAVAVGLDLWNISIKL